MKNLLIAILGSFFIATCAFAQTEVAKGDTNAATRANRLKFGATPAGRAGQKLNTGNFGVFALLSEVTAATNGAVTTVNGKTGPTVTLLTTDIAEGVNQYYTNARARGALSATGPLVYTSSSGSLSMAAATNSVDGYLTAADRTLFAAKEPAITAGTPGQYLRGDKSLGTLNTTAVVEGTNLYYTDARARLSESATAPLVYNNATGVTSIPAATNSVDGYLTAADRTLFNSKQSPQTTLAGYGITDADPYATVATYQAMDALTFAANTGKRILVQSDNVYKKVDGSNGVNTWYYVWADSSAVMHADKLATISEK